MRKRIVVKYNLAYIMCAFKIIFSQSNNLYYHYDPGLFYEGQDILISQLMFTEDPIKNGFIFFRNLGEISYQELEMYYDEGRWKGIIPGDRVTLKGIEYFTILTKSNGGKISFTY